MATTPRALWWSPPNNGKRNLCNKSQTLAEKSSTGQMQRFNQTVHSQPWESGLSAEPWKVSHYILREAGFPILFLSWLMGRKKQHRKTANLTPVRVKISGIHGGLNLRVDYPLATVRRELLIESRKNRPWNSNREGTKLQPAGQTSHPPWVNTNRPSGEITAEPGWSKWQLL